MKGKGNTLVKLIVAAVALFFLWTKGVPWLKQHGTVGGGSTPAISPASSSRSNDSCVSYAESASSAWGSGVTHFANPPYDLAAWDDFESGVASQIRKAEEECSCGEESCAKSRQAMSELRGVVSEADSAIRGNGPPPSDLVQRQELIDNAIEEARDLVRQGK